tara:strand:- start:2692 stop:3681 length:990 start_codon:yes stop_codon:yes gene_type:complete
MNKEIIEIYYNRNTKLIFDFLACFITDKFYNKIYKVAEKHTLTNEVSVSDNYSTIVNGFLDTLVIKNKDEEEEKSKLFGMFLNKLYENYSKYINNEMVNIHDFLLKINTTFLPNNYKDDIYVKSKENLSSMFNTIIYKLSRNLYQHLSNNIDTLILTRTEGNITIIRKQCVIIMCGIKHDIELKLETEDDDNNNNNEQLNNELLKESEFYKETLEENDKLKKMIKILLERDNKHKSINNKLKEILISNNKKYINYINELKKLNSIKEDVTLSEIVIPEEEKNNNTEKKNIEFTENEDIATIKDDKEEVKEDDDNYEEVRVKLDNLFNLP